MTHDPRRLFANSEVAHISLRGAVEAPRFLKGEEMRVISPTAGIKRGPEATALERQSLYGWPITVLDKPSASPTFLRDETMGYVGYLKTGALDSYVDPTHRVGTRQTLLFDAPDFKYPDPLPLSLGSLLKIEGVEGRFSRTHDGRYAITSHLAPLDTPDADPASVAALLLATPYLWGGNSAFGIDCSGLVQAACFACGLSCPGDSDMQSAKLGKPLSKDTALQRNDLLFWKGHVALVVSGDTLIHANAFHMSVTYETIDGAIKRIADQGDGSITARRRLILPKL